MSSPLVSLPRPFAATAVDTRSFFKLYWTCFKVLGAVAPTANVFYFVYSVLLRLLVNLCYPLHLALMLFRSHNSSDNIQNLTVCVTCIVCSVKFIIFVLKMGRIHELESIVATLDARACSPRERGYFLKIRKDIRRIIIGFLSLYAFVGVSAELMFIFRNEPNLLYPGWFPFDWRASKLKFYAAHFYQIVGISYLLIQNFVNDCFPTIVLALLSAHIKLLGIRVSQIGHEVNSLDANELELLCCIKDQEEIYKMLNTIQNIISLPMFLQFTITAVNICLTMAALLFYVDAPFDRLYYLVYLIGLFLEIFPTCYYGTDFQLLFETLHIEMYASNWVEQTQKFRKHMILFCERSLKKQVVMAGGIIHIHLDTFVSTCKGAYSLLAVIMKMNE